MTKGREDLWCCTCGMVYLYAVCLGRLKRTLKLHTPLRSSLATFWETHMLTNSFVEIIINNIQYIESSPALYDG